MSTTDASKALGNATEEVARAGANWLFGQPPVAVLSVVMMTVLLGIGYYTAEHVIPSHLQEINSGYEKQAVAYDKSLDKVIAAFKEDREKDEKYINQILDIMKDDRKPIAVLPK